MRTTVSEDDELDLSGLDELEQEYNGEAAVLQARIDGLEAENAELIRQIASATVEEAAVLLIHRAREPERDAIGFELIAVKSREVHGITGAGGRITAGGRPTHRSRWHGGG